MSYHLSQEQGMIYWIQKPPFVVFLLSAQLCMCNQGFTDIASFSNSGGGSFNPHYTDEETEPIRD